jgi:hypothetical protein
VKDFFRGKPIEFLSTVGWLPVRAWPFNYPLNMYHAPIDLANEFRTEVLRYVKEAAPQPRRMRGNPPHDTEHNKVLWCKDFGCQPVEPKSCVPNVCWMGEGPEQPVEPAQQGWEDRLLMRENGILVVLSLSGSRLMHTLAPSLRGFMGFVYDDGLCLHPCRWRDEVGEGAIEFPVAVRFEKGKE